MKQDSMATRIGATSDVDKWQARNFKAARMIQQGLDPDLASLEETARSLSFGDDAWRFRHGFVAYLAALNGGRIEGNGPELLLAAAKSCEPFHLSPAAMYAVWARRLYLSFALVAGEAILCLLLYAGR